MTSVEAPGAPQAKAAFGRSLSDFGFRIVDGTPTGPFEAENKLVPAVARGEPCFVSDLDWTKEDDLKKLKEDQQYRVRPELLRCLALGCDPAAPLHEQGIRLMGAFIPGDLDLENGEVGALLGLYRCYLVGTVTLRDARTRTVNLAGSRVAGLEGDGATIRGDVFLRNRFKAEGEVRLPGAEIGGDLSCSGASFDNKGGNALSCDRAKIVGTVFLDDGFKAEGEVRLLSAEIGGALVCRNGTLQNKHGVALFCDGARVTGSVFLDNSFKSEGMVRLTNAEIGGNLGCSKSAFQNKDGVALFCDSANIAGALFLRNGFKADGAIDLTATHARSLVDDDVGNNEDGASALVLDGFTYERITGQAPTDAKTRATWLKRQRTEDLGAEFRPQPFEQLAKVLRAMGHDRDAREIGFLKEQLFRPQRVRRAGPFAKPFVWLQWWIYGLVAGYGYKPHRILWILFFLWLGGAAIYWQAAAHGFFAPAEAQVWTQQQFAKCSPPAGNWTRCPAAEELPHFQPLLYSADVLIPIIDMGQRKHWEPMQREFPLWLPHVPEWFTPAWLLSWLLSWLIAAENVLGALLVLLFGAIVAGLVKRD